MKRSLVLVLAALVAIALFGGLVYVALLVAHVSEPAASTVHGLTPRRAWATASALLGLIGVVIGGLALRRFVGRIGNGGRKGAIVATAAGVIALVNGGLNLALATGGPGTGNGVVGGAGALVLGLSALVLGGLVLARPRHTGAT
jgi:hypothetical protein